MPRGLTLVRHYSYAGLALDVGAPGNGDIHTVTPWRKKAVDCAFRAGICAVMRNPFIGHEPSRHRPFE
jgi:hypothetical protein